MNIDYLPNALAALNIL